VVVSIPVGLAGIILPVVLGSWWWVVLIVAGVLIWRANRRSMEQFFLEQLRENEDLFRVVAQNEDVRVVLR
jgi:hypothetical protein